MILLRCDDLVISDVLGYTPDDDSFVVTLPMKYHEWAQRMLQFGTAIDKVTIRKDLGPLFSYPNSYIEKVEISESIKRSRFLRVEFGDVAKRWIDDANYPY